MELTTRQRTTCLSVSMAKSSSTFEHMRGAGGTSPRARREAATRSKTSQRSSVRWKYHRLKMTRTGTLLKPGTRTNVKLPDSKPGLARRFGCVELSCDGLLGLVGKIQFGRIYGPILTGHWLPGEILGQFGPEPGLISTR